MTKRTRSMPVMVMVMVRLALALTLTVSVGLVAACGDDGAQDAAPPAQATADLPADLFSDLPPSGAVNVSAAKADAKEGDVIVVRGRVGGASPFVPGRAVMTLADTDKLIACSDREHDPCPQPWDYCCESPDDIAANSMMVQVVDADGRPLKVGLEGAGGIAPLDFVVVTGKVGPRPDPNVLILELTSIHVEN